MELDDAQDQTEENILTQRPRPGTSGVPDSLSTIQNDPSTRWLLALHDPLADLYTFPSLIAFADLLNDGDMKLAIVDLGNGVANIRLNIYRGTNLQTQLVLIDIPSAITPFYMDATDSINNPALAVACGHMLYIYKNLKPFYKFQLPSLDINQTEADAWAQVRQENIDVTSLRDILQSLSEESSDLPLTPQSLRFLNIQDDSQMEDFVSRYKNVPLKRNTVITCMLSMKRSLSEEKAISCIVIGTEHREVLFIEPDAFTVLAKTFLSNVPVLLDVNGLFDVEFRLVVSCRDANLYSIKRGAKSAKLLVQLTSHPIGLTQVNSNVVVACMDQTLNCYNVKGHLLWTVSLGGQATALEGIEIEMLSMKLVAVALDTSQVILYHDKHQVDIVETSEVVNSMKFGKYGRESGTLVMVSRNGSLTIRILKRSVKFYPREVSTPSNVTSKLVLPKKTKLFIDQTMRERQDFENIHRTFQQDLYRLKLLTTRSFARAISTRLQPVSSGATNSLKVSAQVHGLGPTFKLVLQLVNHSDAAIILLFLAFDFDPKIYKFTKTNISVPYLVPSLVYTYETTVQCVSNLNVTDAVKVFVMKEGEVNPIMTALINMPASEVVGS